MDYYKSAISSNNSDMSPKELFLGGKERHTSLIWHRLDQQVRKNRKRLARMKVEFQTTCFHKYIDIYTQNKMGAQRMFWFSGHNVQFEKQSSNEKCQVNNSEREGGRRGCFIYDREIKERVFTSYRIRNFMGPLFYY